MDSQGSTISLSAFFKDARLHSRSAPLLPDEAADLLRRFFAGYSMEACNADQLLALADLSVRARDVEQARAALRLAAALPARAHLARYKLGRLELAGGNPEAAAAAFAAGAAAEPGFAHNWMGGARALLMLERHREAADLAERFLALGQAPQTPDDLTALADIADQLFEHGERQRAGPIYAVLRGHAGLRSKAAVRHAEALIDAGEHGAALAMLRPAARDGTLDVWGRRALAACESQAGHHEEALRLAESVLTERPADAGFVATFMDVLVSGRDAARWADTLARLGGLLPADARTELQIRLLLSRGEAGEAAALLSGVTFAGRTQLFYAGLETAYACLAAGDVAATEAIGARLEAAAPNLAAPLLLRVDMYLRQQSWEAAAEVLRAVPAAEAQHPEVKLKWFEYYSFAGNAAEAARLQAELEAAGLPSRQATLPILRFLAEQRRWEELVDRALAWIGADLRYDQIGYVLFRAARHTGRQAALCAAVEAVEGWRGLPSLARLHTALAWDRADTLPEMAQVSAQAPLASPAMRARMAAEQRVLARATAPAGRRALFLCSDANYLGATIVALHSALSHSAPGREDCFIVVDDSLAARTEALVAGFRERGFAVQVVAASAVLDGARKLYPAYGLFTSGHMLASAAYYRIYFARHLQRLGTYTRAVYVDSDVLVRAPLDTLFAAALDGHPLAARVETPRPEVSHAIRLHDLRDDLYFNSGVLLFDLANPALAAALDGAVAAVADDGVTLLFHDQCALNLGFRDAFQPMVTAWNQPVAEATRVADIPAETAVLHYLDRPKPWSAAYDGECATLWFEAWQQAATVIGEAAAMELLRMTGG